jgi:hypothetical protein
MTELRSFTRQHLEGARRVPGFRLTRECLGLGGNDAPATHGLRGNSRAATDGGL